MSTVRDGLPFRAAADPLGPRFRPPPLAAGVVQLWLLPHAGAEPRWRALLAAHAGCPVEALVLARGVHGKPRLPGSALRFSLSRAEQLALFALARDHELGADLEWLGRRVARPEALLRRCFLEPERAAIAAAPDPGRALLEAWCAKEAVVKGIGRGIAFGLRRVHLGQDAASVPGEAGAACWRLWSFEPAPGYVGALACREPDLVLQAFRVP